MNNEILTPLHPTIFYCHSQSSIDCIHFKIQFTLKFKLTFPLYVYHYGMYNFLSSMENKWRYFEEYLSSLSYNECGL